MCCPWYDTEGRAPRPRPADLATAHKHLAIIALEQDDPASAREHLERARALLLPAYDEDHPDIGDVDNHLGEALRRLGLTEEARTALLHALRIRGRHGDHPDAVGTLIRLGRLHRDTGELEQSYERLTQARRMAAAVMGPDHPYVADAERDLAETLIVDGRTAEAIDTLTEALRRYEGAYGAGHSLSAGVRARLGQMDPGSRDPSSA
ncbi:tetratricopeptide repeat protein [Streptomyces sp. SD31]|uniref:tetratricopeptide repeat protein n=1 Tax=Streptomyces sp. SD31 TaxID=3452208 RepID=UPI003F8BC101